MSTSHHHGHRVELASRECGRISVTLVWASDVNAAAVLVRNDSADDQFELLVEPDRNPIDVYEHPYAYAAWRGIHYRPAGLPALA